MDDMDDPMAVASPIGKQGGYTNGYDSGPAKGWSHPGGGGGGMMVNLSMDDDVMDPIAASMELPDSRYDPQSQRRQSPVSYQSDPYDQRLDPNQHYLQSSPGYSSYPGSNEPTRDWQYGTVRLSRNPTCGFGLAVIGGKDNPTNTGEISIIVKDILPNGPADVRLKKNDRLLTVNGISMENVEHAVAVGALRRAGDSVVIEYKRKVQAPAPITKAQTLPSYSQPPQFDNTDQSFNTGSYYTPPSQRSASQPPTRRAGSQLSLTNSQGRPSGQREYVTLTKTRNEGFGMQLGWKLFVQGMSEYGVAANQGLQKGDTLVKINNYPVESLSLSDAKRIIQTSGNSLNLEIMREPQAPQFSTPAYTSRSVDRLDRMSLGRGEEQPPLQRGYAPQQQSHHQQAPSTNELLQEQDDDPLHSALPPRPPLPRAERAQHTFSMPPPRPPSPGKTEFMGISDEVVEGEERTVSFIKGKSVGLQVIGGNDSGVYVGRIQPGSNAAYATSYNGERIHVGDRIVEVNGMNLLGKTKEEVILLLLGVINEVKLVLRESSAFKAVLHGGIGDRFFIRAHFVYEAPTPDEMGFTKGTVFRVVDTMPEGVMGHWYVLRLDRANTPVERGIIPNENRASQLNLAHQNKEAQALKPATFEGRKGKFKRLGMRASMRSKSMIKDQWDEIIFGGRVLKFPAYERVILREVGFSRPVVLFGAVADLVRERLLREMPDKFETPLMNHTLDSRPGEPMHVNPQGSIKLHAIKDIMDKGKHCLLDVTPNAVEQLNYAQCYPIVIFLNAESRAHVKEIRGQFLGEGVENKGSRKHYQTAKKMKKFYSYVFTAMIPVNPDSMWYSQIKEAVHIQQNKKIWISEAKIGDDLDEETTLNVIGQLTLPPDYESDAESVFTNDSRSMANDSMVESDFEPVSPTDTYKEDSYNFPEESFEKKEELPVSAVVPPTNEYSSDDEPEVKPVIRSSRPRHKKRADKQRSEPRPSSKERGLLGRFPSLSRSESRGRQSDFDDEDLDDSTNANKYNVDSRSKYSDRLEKTWTPTERPSRREHMKRRELIEKENAAKEEEAKKRAEKINAASSQPGIARTAPAPGAIKLPQLEEPPQRGQRPVVAPKPSITRPTTVPPAAPQPKPRIPPKETTFGVKETTFGVEEEVVTETSPPPIPEKPRMETTFGGESDLQWGLEFDGPNLMEEPVLRTAPPPAPKPKQTTEPVYAQVQKDRQEPPTRSEPPPRPEPPRSLDPPEFSRPTNGLYFSDNAAPSWQVEPDIVPRPLESQESAPPSWRVESPYAQVDSGIDRPSPEEPPPQIRHPEPKIVNIKSNYVESHQVTQMGRLDDWDQSGERDPPLIMAQVQSTDYSEPPSNIDFKKQMKDAYTKLQKVQVRESPRGWEHPQGRNSPSVELTQVPQTEEKPRWEEPKQDAPSREPPNGLSDSGTSDTDKYSNIPEGKPDPAPRKAPYDRQSYKEYREAFFKRSKSPGRQYQENLYAPKGWNSRKKENNNAASFWSIPISEDSLNAEEGHEVLDTVRGFFDYTGGVLSSTTTGVSIVIPKGALPEGGRQEILFKVCRDTNMLPPLDKDKGETLLSPVVICKPHGLKFLKPVELRLPHCASMTPDGWSFNLKSSDAGTGNAPSEWQNMVIPGGEEGQCQVNANSVSILVDHF